MGISTMGRIRFKRRASHVPNLMHKLLKYILTGKHTVDHFGLNIVKISWVRRPNKRSNLYHLGRPKKGFKFGTRKDRRLNWAKGYHHKECAEHSLIRPLTLVAHVTNEK